VSLARVLFIALGVTIVVLAAGIVTTQRLVRSLLLHIVTLFLLGLAYLIAGAHLMGVVQIIVYAGSITVLLVFALMLTPVGHGSREALDHQSRLRAALASAGLLGLILYALLSASATRAPIDPPELAEVAARLFTTYAYPFELLSLVLIAALVGVAVIARLTTEQDAEGEAVETL
jgi:NADH-quinone oxidoreductase subunit J